MTQICVAPENTNAHPEWVIGNLKKEEGFNSHNFERKAIEPKLKFLKRLEGAKTKKKKNVKGEWMFSA